MIRLILNRKVGDANLRRFATHHSYECRGVFVAYGGA